MSGKDPHDEVRDLQARVAALETVVAAIREAVAGTAIGARISHTLRGKEEE